MPKDRSEAWFRRSIQHVSACVAEADKQHTPDELVAAEMFLAGVPKAPQQSLFSTPPNAGLIAGGQPEPTGLADRGCVGQ